MIGQQTGRVEVEESSQILSGISRGFSPILARLQPGFSMENLQAPRGWLQTEQISSPCLRLASLSPRFGTNSWPTNPL